MDIEQTHQSARSMSAADDRSRLHNFQLPRNKDFPEHSRQYYDNNYASDQGPGPATMDVTPPRFVARPRPRFAPHTANKSAQEKVECLTAEETIELFTRKIEDARKETRHVFAGTEDVTNALKPTLTIDLGRTRIERLPDAIVDLIITDVERLSLSHNYLRYIPARIAECSQLRYLNIRSNDFKEIPPSIYRMPLLEILDVSKNKITNVPPEIKKLEALRVFSIVHNRLTDLPVELADLPRLKVLKVAENPFRKSIKRVIQDKEAEVAYPEMPENERDTALTMEIVRFLRSMRSTSTMAPVSESIEPTDASSETIRPARRALSGRFPVIPAAAASQESLFDSKDGTTQYGKPSVPMKSHLRGLSGQSNQGGLSKRPGIAPLVNGNERNRSNSESVVQASVSSRQKRMGMFRRDRTELDSIDETKVARQSQLHLRGYSHGSSMRRSGSISSPGAASSSPLSPKESRKDKNQFVRRLSSLPEHKTDFARRPMVEGAKGMLYALYQVHPHISGLIAASKDRSDRRSGLEMSFYYASTHIDKLNKSLEMADQIEPEDEESWDRLEDTINADCAICIKSFVHVTSQMQECTHKIVANADPRYVRSLMLLLYGSMVEIRNAIRCFGIEVKHHRRHMSSGATHPIATIPEEPTPPESARDQPNPDRDLDAMTIKAPPRLRSDTILKHPALEPSVLQPVQPPHLQIPSNNSHVPPINGTYSRSNSALGGTIHKSFAARSRSSSSSTNMLSAGDIPSSAVSNTSKSSDSYGLPPMASLNGRLNPSTGLTDAQEEQQMDQIFLALTKAYEVALQAVPITTQQLRRCVETAKELRQSKEVIDTWNALVDKSKICYDLTQGLQIRLSGFKTKDSGVGLSHAESGRHDPSFWTLCRAFLQSFIVLVTEMKEVRKMQLLVLPQEIVGVLRPVQKACRDAGLAINASPWGHMFQGVNSMPAPTPFAARGGEVHRAVDQNKAANASNGNMSSYSAAMSKQTVNQAQAVYHQVTTRSQVPSLSSLPTPTLQASGSASVSSGASPSSAQMPATPLSAALGPAVQATVPSTPASLYGDSFFKGDVFQRADSLLSMPQAPGASFLNRR